jgi:Ca2+-binding RTX toxin-like protein
VVPRVKIIFVFAAAAALLVAVVPWAGAGPVVNAKCQGRIATITGTKHADVIVSDEDSDTIAGLGGNDKIYGRRGFDIICGGGGADQILGGPDNDKLFGENGDDFLKGGPGHDRVVGGPGKDIERK